MATETIAKLTEATDQGAVATGSKGRRREITIIREGWGSSGYYSRKVIERDGPRIFPPGTQMFVDHPTEAEEQARPERSVKDLAAVIVESPRMAGDALVAVAEIKQHWEPVIDALAEDIGLSIRAAGMLEDGEAEGRTGPIVTALTEGYSVDFVTRAGAGGKIGKLIESAREKAPEPTLEEARNAANWLEARIHRDFTSTADYLFGEGYLTRQERIGLSSAIGEALTAFNTHVAENLPGLLQRDPYADSGQAEVTESGDSRREQEGTMSDKDNAQRLSDLEESVRTMQTQLDEAKQNAADEKARADRAEEALQGIRAGKVVAEAIKDLKLPEGAVKRVVESTLATSLPVTQDGKLDEGALAERAKTKAREEQDYIAQMVGGGSAPAELGESSLAALGIPAGGETDKNQTALAEAMQSLGMPENAAARAAEGR